MQNFRSRYLVIHKERTQMLLQSKLDRTIVFATIAAKKNGLVQKNRLNN